MHKNIWIFNHYIVPPSIGDDYRHNNFAKYLNKLGYKTTLFFSSYIHNFDRNLIIDNKKYCEESIDNVRYVAVKTRCYKKNGFQRLFNILDYFFGLFRVTSKVKRIYEKPDIIIASSVHPLTCLAGIWIAKRHKVKCIVEIRDLWPYSMVVMGKIKEKSIVARLLYSLEKYIYKRADSIIFTGENEKQYLMDRGLDKCVNMSKVYYVNNGVDLELFDYNLRHFNYEDELLDNDKIFKVVYTGSIGHANALNYIVEAAKYIQDKGYKGIRFIIFGTGNERVRLEEYCQSNNIGIVKFMGRVSKKYIPSILNKADLLIFTSQNITYKYGLSLNKMFDYFASRKPIISNIKTSNDLISKFNCGITVEPNSKESIAYAILKIYYATESQYASYLKGSRLALNEYSYKTLTNKLEQIIMNTMQDNHK